MLLNSLSSTRFAPPPAITRVARTTVSPAHQQREGVTIHPQDSDRLKALINVMLLKAYAWACTQATDRQSARVQSIESWRKSRIVSSEELTQFMTDLNNKLPVINVSAYMAKFRNVWETFRGANNHFSLSDIRHQPGSAGRENEIYELVLGLDLGSLSDVARKRVLAMATQIMNAQRKARNSYDPVFVQGFRAFPFDPSPQPVIDDNTIRLVIPFFPTSRFTTEKNFRKASTVMDLLTRPSIVKES